MILERLIIEYLGQPKTQLYFADYYGDNFKTRAVLFSFASFESNYNGNNYNEEELNLINNYLEKVVDEKTSHNDNVEFLKFLALKKNITNQDD